MLPWSRSVPSSDPNLPTSPGFLANHHRSVSSNKTATSSNTPSSPPSHTSSKSQSSRSKVRRREPSAGEVPGQDDETWTDGSDDEAAITALAASQREGGRSLGRVTSGGSIASLQGGFGGSGMSNGSNISVSTTKPTSPTPALPSPSASWSFNPFSIIASASPKSPTIPLSPPPTGNSRAMSPQPKSALANSPVIRARENSRGKGKEVVSDGDTEEEKLEASEMKRRGSSYRKEVLLGAIKPDVEDLVRDPVSLLSRLNPASCAPPPSPKSHRESMSISRPSPARRTKSSFANDSDSDDSPSGYVSLNALNLSSEAPEIIEFGKEEELEEDKGEAGRAKRRRQKFVDCLGAENVDLAELRKLAWAGIPNDLRPIAWQLLLGYLPAPSSRRLATLARKRQEYADAVRLAFSRGVKSLDGPIWHQISIDVPRTNPGVTLWQGQATQRALERILYVWAIRHPASGYVQGINDLVTPFFQVFLSSYITMDPESYDVSALPPSVLEALEADSFWCLSKLLDGIQDNYIFAQPGIQRQVARMKELCSRVDAPLAHHLEENSVEFIQFAFRWMNCLLMRELSVKNIVRMWDTYLAEGADAFSEFHLYVCLAFLVKWSDQLRGMDFQAIIMFLQSLPTQDWTDQNTELLLSEAFMWSRTFEAR